MDKTQFTGPPVSTRFLIFSASLRTDSLNTRLARLAARVIEDQGGIVDVAAMQDFDCRSYNQEIEENEGLPSGATELRAAWDRPRCALRQ